MELNLIYENSVNGLVLPNCQPKEVFEFSRDWIIKNNSKDMGYLIKDLFNKFGNNISVLTSGLGLQTIPQNGYDSKTDITVNRYSISDVLMNPQNYAGKKLLFIIEPFGHIDFFKNNLNEINKQLFEDLKKINATIIINYSHEGHLNDFFITEILKTISYKKIIFLYNDYLNDYKKFESKNVKFIKVNYYLNRSSRYFQTNFIDNNVNELLDYSKKEYYFLSFNQYPHHHRVKLISELHKKNIIDKFLISYNPKFYEVLGGARYDFENQLKDLGYIDDYNFFISLPEKKVDFDTNFQISGYGFEDVAVYKKSAISLISDTIFFKRQGFISEKVFKPIMYLQPFIIAGPPYYLQELRNMGFKTFDGFIDESYDAELDDKIRLDKIIKELQRICEIPFEELKKTLNEIEDILLFNQMKLLSFDFSEYELQCLTQIIKHSYKNESQKNLL
jgi:hypothetical protein